MNRLRKGDLVRVKRGNHSGKEGKIKAILADKNRVIIEGVDKIKSYKKGKGMVEKERSIHSSNVVLLSSDKKKEELKVSYTFKDGKKERVTRKRTKS